MGFPLKIKSIIELLSWVYIVQYNESITVICEVSFSTDFNVVHSFHFMNREITNGLNNSNLVIRKILKSRPDMSLASYSSFVLLFILYFLTENSLDHTYVCKDIYIVCNTRKTSQWGITVLLSTYIYVIHSLQAQIYVLIRNFLNMDSFAFTNYIPCFL